MSRKKKFVLNVTVSLIYRIITIICGFLLPMFLIPHFGSDVNGLVNSITQFLGIIILLESGVGAVVQSALYKPLAKKDEEEISKIVKSSKNFFDKITLITIGCIFLLVIFYPYLVSSKFSFSYTATLIIILSFSHIIQHYLFVTYRLLLSADQLLFINVGVRSVCLLLNTIFTIILIKCGASIHFIELICSMVFLIQPIVIYLVVHKRYHLNLKNELKEEPIKQKWNGFAQHISSVILASTDTIILTLFSTLENVSIYSVYYLVVFAIKQIFVSALSGIQSLFGNMLANKENDKLNKLFTSVELLSHNITLILYLITGIIITPFIMIYTKDFTDANYIVPSFGIVITIAYAFFTLRLPYEMIIKAAGHYKQTQTSSFVEVIINIVVSIILVFKYGLIGVACGTLAAMIYRTIYLVCYLSNNILNHPKKIFFKLLFEDFIVIIVMSLITRFITLEKLDYISLIIMTLKIGIACMLIIIIVNILFNRKEINIIKKLINKKEKYSLCQKVFHKIDELIIPVVAPIRRKLINNTDFTIISNNCWGAKCYEFFGLKKQSPTIGLYFFADDYIKFVYNLKYYLSCKIEMIDAKNSKYKKQLEEKNQLDVPVGKLADIEVIFLHYKDPKLAKEKWDRRVKRVNWNNLIFKFSYMNECTEKHLKQFSKISGVKKIMFITSKNEHYNDSYIVPAPKNQNIENDTYCFRRYVNIYKIINSKKTSIDDLKIK